MGSLRRAAALAVLSGLAGCAIQRSNVASQAQKDMVGMQKEAVLACMGAPASDAKIGSTEVWSYNSGDGRVVNFGTASTFATGQSYTAGNATLLGNSAAFNSQTIGSANTNMFRFGLARRYYCIVNIVFSDDRVSRVNYSGPTGAPLAPREQCAYAVQNCIQLQKE